MIIGTTKSGFSFRLTDGITRDFRFLRACKKLRSPDATQQLDGAMELVSAVFADDAEEERFLLHVAGGRGRADIETVYRELGEIIAKASEDADTKKS